MAIRLKLKIALDRSGLEAKDKGWGRWTQSTAIQQLHLPGIGDSYKLSFIHCFSLVSGLERHINNPLEKVNAAVPKVKPEFKI